MIKIASDVLDWNNPKLCKLRFPRWTHTEVYDKYHITLGENLEFWLWWLQVEPYLLFMAPVSMAYLDHVSSIFVRFGKLILSSEQILDFA